MNEIETRNTESYPRERQTDTKLRGRSLPQIAKRIVNCDLSSSPQQFYDLQINLDTKLRRYVFFISRGFKLTLAAIGE